MIDETYSKMSFLSKSVCSIRMFCNHRKWVTLRVVNITLRTHIPWHETCDSHVPTSKWALSPTRAPFKWYILGTNNYFLRFLNSDIRLSRRPFTTSNSFLRLFVYLTKFLYAVLAVYLQRRRQWGVHPTTGGGSENQLLHLSQFQDPTMLMSALFTYIWMKLDL